MKRKLFPPLHRGRGAPVSPPPRFLPARVETAAEELQRLADEGPEPLRTTVTPEASRSILARNDSPDIPFNRSINPYKGCEHGCVYCFARPTHAYLDLSPGLDFETRIFSKPDAAQLLRAALARPAYRCETIALGSNTDPYQPVERRLGITRQLLEVFVETRHPVAVVTKSTLVLRDVDLLQDLARDNLAHVSFSVTTLDAELARRMEPRAAAPRLRLEAVRRLTDSGVPCGVLFAPVIPALNDGELEGVFAAAADAGATRASYLLLRLPHELKEIFTAWLHRHYPLRAQRVLARIRETRGGNRLNDPRFGTRQRGTGVLADLLARRSRVALRRLGFPEGTPPLDTALFRPPRRIRRRRLPLFDS